MSNRYKNLVVAAMVAAGTFGTATLPAFAQLQTFQKRVATGADDVEEAASGTIYTNSSDLELVYDNTDTGNQTVGLRFTGVTLPANATIIKAYVQFAVDEVTTGACNVRIQGQAIDNAPAFSSTNFNVSSRARTGASISWAPVGWSVVNQAGPDQATPDLKAVIEEIVKRPGWVSGNALALVITGTGKRNAHAFEGSAAMAPQLVIQYTTNGDFSGPFPVAKNSIWRFHDKGQDLGNAWTAPDFNDAAWAYGSGVLGYGDPVATLLSFGGNSSNKYPTYYLRHGFNVSDAGLYDSLVFNIRRDDGAVVYLNGVEQFRTNMPAGPIAYNTWASGTVDGANETAYSQFKVSAKDLRDGRNVLAVSAHQDRASSSDVTFDLELQGQEKPAKPDVDVVTLGSPWKYLDNGSDQGTAWQAATFDDATWKTGAAVLGYGNGDEATTLSFGPNPAQKHITTYFRKTFTVADTALFNSLELNLIRDDAAVVYLNGTEVLRSNLLAGDLTSLTPAVAVVDGTDETTPVVAYINKKLLKEGQNTLAVEVHKYNAVESDLRFDLNLRLMLAPKPLTPVTVHYACDPSGSADIGCFTSVRPTAQTQLLVLPETHTFQVLAKSGTTRYTSGGTGTLPGNNDFTAYVGKAGSSTEGFLSINHENNPGGVSMLSLALNPQNKLWEVNKVHQVDFSPLVKTERNCSGGITPWGTVITSEETTASGDLNGDGYLDVGFNVEIDPVTGEIVDYDGDGKPDKLWALGRMNHENVAVSTDGVTVYQAEDGGSGGVYKYVAYQKGNLSAGDLYVLRLDPTNLSSGSWVKVPNTTKTERNTTSSLAGSLGGTNWSGPEDVEFGPDGKMYFTSKGTGTIWRFKDDGTTVSEVEAWVTNRPYAITHREGTQTENWGTGIDNLTFDGEGNLWALQDGGRNHLWVIRPDHTPENPKVELFATIPTGAEPTGLTFSPDFRYGFISLQHPSGANTATQPDASGAQVQHNAATTLVFARKEFLGQAAIAPVFDLGADQVLCQGESVKLTAYPGADAVVVWSTGETGPEITVTTSGTYTATAYADNGQTYTDAVEVTFEELTVELGENQALCKGCLITLDAGAGYSSYRWSDGSIGQTLTAATAGTYSVTVTNALGCTATDAVEVVDRKPGNALVPVQMLKVYPNPFEVSTLVEVTVPERAQVAIEVYTQDGTKVQTIVNETLEIGTYRYTFQPTGQVKNGMFMLRMQVNNQQYSTKLIQK